MKRTEDNIANLSQTLSSDNSDVQNLVLTIHPLQVYKAEMKWLGYDTQSATLYENIITAKTLAEISEKIRHAKITELNSYVISDKFGDEDEDDVDSGYFSYYFGNDMEFIIGETGYIHDCVSAVFDNPYFDDQTKFDTLSFLFKSGLEWDPVTRGDIKFFEEDVYNAKSKALMYFAIRDIPGAVQFLLEQGADPFAENNRGLAEACRFGNKDNVKVLLEAMQPFYVDDYVSSLDPFIQCIAFVIYDLEVMDIKSEEAVENSNQILQLLLNSCRHPAIAATRALNELFIRCSIHRVVNFEAGVEIEVLDKLLFQIKPMVELLCSYGADPYIGLPSAAVIAENAKQVGEVAYYEYSELFEHQKHKLQMNDYGVVKSLLLQNAPELENNGQDAQHNAGSAFNILSNLIQRGGERPVAKILSSLTSMRTSYGHTPKNLFYKYEAIAKKAIENKNKEEIFVFQNIIKDTHFYGEKMGFVKV